MLVHKMSVLLRFLYSFQFFQELYFIIYLSIIMIYSKMKT